MHYLLCGGMYENINTRIEEERVAIVANGERLE
jgi:hypothetical protein